jgi:hypothetical protein
MCDRFVQVASADHLEFRLSCCGVEPGTWALSLFAMLLTCFTMEQRMFGDYESRLKLDDELLRMRGEFERHKEQLRRDLKVRYEVKPPQPRAIIHWP